MNTKKVALITGSSNGIGKEIAIEFLKMNYTVVINGRNSERLNNTKTELENIGGNILSYACDISDHNQAKNLISFAIKHCGQINILINNAGVTLNASLEQTQPLVFRKVYDTNIFGALNATISALPYIKKTKGSIIFMSSIAAFRGLPNFSAYCSSKRALRSIAESLRIEEAGSGIHVGLIYIGFTKNDPNKKTLTANGQLRNIQNNKGFNTQSPNSVARAVIMAINKRKFIVTLSRLGKTTRLMQILLPTIVEQIIIKRSSSKTAHAT